MTRRQQAGGDQDQTLAEYLQTPAARTINGVLAFGSFCLSAAIFASADPNIPIPLGCRVMSLTMTSTFGLLTMGKLEEAATMATAGSLYALYVTTLNPSTSNDEYAMRP